MARALARSIASDTSALSAKTCCASLCCGIRFTERAVAVRWKERFGRWQSGENSLDRRARRDVRREPARRDTTTREASHATRVTHMRNGRGPTELAAVENASAAAPGADTRRDTNRRATAVRRQLRYRRDVTDSAHTGSPVERRCISKLRALSAHSAWLRSGSGRDSWERGTTARARAGGTGSRRGDKSQVCGARRESGEPETTVLKFDRSTTLNSHELDDRDI